MTNLAGKIVVVTGAGSGIGRATAHAFANLGARVALCDVDRARVDAMRGELGERAVVASVVDVADRAQMQRFADDIHGHCDAVDVVVNNAGVAVGGTFLDTSLDDWDWLLGINLRGVVHGCHMFVPKMVARGQGGHVVNISSVFGLYAPPGVSAYVASKFAVLGMSKSLRAELAPHRIGVTAICPGMIATQIVGDGRMYGDAGAGQQKMAKTFAKRGLPPERVAAAIVDSVRTNPDVRPVGRDSWALYALTRLAPTATAKIGATIAKRMRANQ
jgi:NADP-dependent 3-hydroxy acid dehydrogenase YdfG|nr:SDR family NAD(P)-dependent oxidoreductase [Kofleriaceae bacterium]